MITCNVIPQWYIVNVEQRNPKFGSISDSLSPRQDSVNILGCAER